MRVLSEDDVRASLSVAEAIDINEMAFKASNTCVPDRTLLSFPEHKGVSLFKPATIYDSGSFGLKVVSVRPGNASKGLPTVPATIMLFDESTGSPVAVMGATYLTALRTAAGSIAVARKLWNSEKVSRVCVFGSGMQARLHLEALRAAFGEFSVNVVNRSIGGAKALAKDFNGTSGVLDDPNVKEWVNKADVVVTATNSSTPIFKGEWLSDNTLVIGVGSYTPAMQELDTTTIARASIILDTNAAESVGDLACATDIDILGTANDLFNGRVRTNDHRSVLMFKSVGTAVQDIATAQAVLESAQKLGLGTQAKLD